MPSEDGTTIRPGRARTGKLAKIGRRRGGDIDGDQQRGRSAHFHGAQTRCVGGDAVAHLFLLFKDHRARLTRVFGDFVVAGGDHYAIDSLGLAKRGQRLPVEHTSQGFALLHAKKPS